MLKRILYIIPMLFFIPSCGPIIGQLMRASEGVKDFKVAAGDLSEIAKARNILVVGPFARDSGAYYIARGDEAGLFAQEINNSGKLHAELHVGDRYGDPVETASSVRSMNASQLKAEFKLKNEPDLVLFGTVLERETIVAPTRGIIMQVGYRLEFFNPATNGSTIVEITVKKHFKDCIKLVVSEIIRRAEIGGDE